MKYQLLVCRDNLSQTFVPVKGRYIKDVKSWYANNNPLDKNILTFKSLHYLRNLFRECKIRRSLTTKHIFKIISL